MKKMKRWLAALLAVCMVIGGIAIPEAARAADQTEVTMTFTKGVAQDANKRYIIYLKPTDGREITGLGTNKSAKVLVGGKSKTATWDDWNAEDGYALALPYTSLAADNNPTANSYIATHYVTIQAGSTVGDVKVKEDIHIKIMGGITTGSANVVHMEQVEELPEDMFLFQVDYNEGQKYFALWFMFADGRNLANIKKNGAYWNALSTTYIDNSSWTSSWNSGDASYYYGMKLDYAQLNSSYTSYSQVGEHIIRIPAGTTVGDLKVPEDWYFSINSRFIKQIEPTTVSLGEGSTYDDENQQYVIQIKPDDGRNIITCGRGSTKISVGDTEVATGISAWEKATDSYTLRINYDTIESGATTADSVGKHKVTIPKGTYVGDVMLEEDYYIEVNGTSVKEYSDTTSTTLSFIDGGYQDQHSRYVVNVKATDVAELELIGNASGTALVNGVETTVGWEGWPSDDTSQTTSYYSITVPYSAVLFSGNTTHASKQGSNYVTIPAGTKIGNIEVSEAFHVKIYGGTMTSNDSLIEPVSELPEYYFGSWNFNTSNVYIQFRNTIGTTADGWTASTQNVYVDGKAVSVRWEGDGSYYYFPLTYFQLGGTALSDLPTKIVRIPKGTIVGKMTLTEDVWIRINSSVREELVPANVSLGADSGYNNTNSQYVIRLTPDDGKTIITPGASSASVLIDGVEVENAISYWDQGSDNYGACIKYNVIESAAEKAADIGVHTITFPAGTYFGNRILTEDFSVCINGESQISTSSPFSLTGSGYQDGQPNNNYRYIFWLKPTDGRDIVSLGSTSATILVDGKKVSSGVRWVDTSATSGYALAVNYSAIESDAAVSTDVGEHIITIPKGTIVGNVAFAEDFMIKVNARDISVYKPPVTVSYSSGGYQDGTNGNYRYIFYLKPDDGREIVNIGSPSTTILVDGKEVSSGISWFKDTNTYALCVKYSAIVSDATSHSQIGEHVLTVPAGTKVGDVEFAEDLYIKVNNGTISELSSVTLQHTETVCGQDGYQMQFTVKGATSAINKISNAEVSVDGKVTDDVSYNFGGTAESGYYIQLLIPYSAVQSGADTAAEVTGTHTIQIGKGALLSDMVLKESVDVLVTGENVTQIRKPDVTVAIAGHDDNATSGATGFYFTVTPEDTLAYNADGTVKYTFVKNGITVDGVLKRDAIVKKLGDNLYYVDLSSYTVNRDTIVGIGGIIQTDDYTVEYTQAYFQYKTTTGWNVYIPPTNTKVTLSNDTINGGENMQGIFMNASSDPLSNGVYASDAFHWDSMGDDDEEPEQHGGIYLNGSICSTATLQKKWDGYYYIDLSNVTELKTGDIITLDGTLFVDNHYVAYNSISYIRNKDGSFSQYDANAEAVPAETVKLNALYVNLDKQSTYTIPSTPLVTGNKVTIMVNGNEVTEYTLTKAGIYKVQRIMENTILADVVSTVGDITYEQNVYMFKTGDANLDASVSVKDIVRMKKNMGKTENLVGGASDLNYDDKLSEADYDLLIDLMLGRTTAEEILSADQSVVIGAISDTHYLANGRDGQNRINTRKALNYYKSQNADVIIFNADITDLGEVGAYEKLVADIKSVYPDEATRPKLIFTGDNHEWYDAWTVNNHTPTATFDETQQRFYDGLSSLRPDCTDNNTHYEVNGYHFIGVSSDDMNGGYALYDDTTVDWIETTLAEAAADDATGKKPIFLSIHQAPKNTVYGSDGADHFDDSETKLTETLAKYPQLVIITSHTHASLQDERSIHQGNYTTLNTASMHYVGGASGTNINSGLMSEKYQFAQGLLIKTNGNAVDIERCDFYNDEKIKDNWTFETSDSTDDYTKYTDARANDRLAPTFASDASIATKWNSDGTATLTFDAATHEEDFVHHYIVKVYKDGSTTPSTYTYSNFFFLGLNRMDKTLEFTLSNLDATKDYTFEIQAVESWGNTSTAISGSLSAK